MKWLILVPALVALGWFARPLWERAERAPVTVRVTVEPKRAPKPVAPVQSARKTPPKPAATPKYDGPSQAGDRDNVGQGFATQGIGYYDVRATSGLPEAR